MAGTSSLLKSAASRRAAIQNEKNRIVDMEWNLSAQTADDLRLYQNHYETASKTAKSSDRITYQSKLLSATRAFRSNEIQRATINVLEGNMDNQAKQDLMVGLYKDAVDNGDYNAAQNLRQQIGNLEQTIMNEKVQAMNTAKQMAEAGYTSIKAFVSDIKSGDANIMGGVSLNYLNDLYRQVGPQGIEPALAELGRRMGIPTPSFIDIAYYYAEQTLANLDVAAANLPADEAAKVMNDKAAYLNGSKKFSLPGLSGDQGISYDDLVRARESQINGSSPIIASMNAADGRPGFTKAPLANWTLVTDANGNPLITANYVQPEIGADVTTALNATNNLGMKQVDAYINGVKQTKKYFMDANGNVKDEQGKGVKLGNAEFRDVLLSPQDALAAKGFRVNANGTVDIPNDPSAPPELAGQKNIKYNVDGMGNIQFAYETKDATGKISSNLFTYDIKNNRFASAAEDLATAKTDQQIFNQNFGGNTLQASKVGDVLQTGKTTREALQTATAAKELASMQAAQQKLQQTATQQQLNTLPNKPLSVQPLPVQQPLQVVNTPPPLQPLQVVNTPSTANVKVYNAPITQGVAPKVKVDSGPAFSGTLKVI